MILIIDMNEVENSLARFEFVDPIVRIVEEHNQEYSVVHWSTITKQHLDTANKIILSGTTLKDNAALEHVGEFFWLKDINKPTLGICMGMHVIAKVFGCELEKCLEIGLTKITTEQDNDLFAGGFEAYTLHQLVAKPSQEVEVLAKSASCIEAIKHKSKPVYGVLFHPEVRNSFILENFIEEIL